MKYPFSGYVTCNGAYVEYKGKCVYKNVVPAEAIKATMDLCEKYHFNYYFEGNDYIYVRDSKDPVHQAFANNWGMKEETIIDKFDYKNIETYIGMIVVTGLGIAMGNAVPELKSVAKYITTNIEEEGITAACKHFNYIKD